VASTLRPVDVLVTDVLMPEMTGDELARRLRLTRRDLKVLYLSGYGDQVFDEKRTMWEGEAFLEKPCTPKGLLDAVSLLTNENRSVCRTAPSAYSGSVRQ
jgi:two-component system, cell cycle sensor histidine kinase and response regulator CckA